MKEKRKNKDVSSEMFMMLAEDARNVNTFGSLGPGGQQIFMDRVSRAHYEEDEEHLIDKRTK